MDGQSANIATLLVVICITMTCVVANGVKSPFDVSSVTTRSEEPKSVCPAGSQEVNNVCVLCAAGTFGDSTSNCVLCAIGEYTDVPGETRCTRCPAGTTTSQPGSTSSSDCVTTGSSGSLVVIAASSVGAGLFLVFLFIIVILNVYYKKKHAKTTILPFDILSSRSNSPVSLEPRHVQPVLGSTDTPPMIRPSHVSAIPDLDLSLPALIDVTSSPDVTNLRSVSVSLSEPPAYLHAVTGTRRPRSVEIMQQRALWALSDTQPVPLMPKHDEADTVERAIQQQQQQQQQRGVYQSGSGSCRSSASIEHCSQAVRSDSNLSITAFTVPDIVIRRPSADEGDCNSDSALATAASTTQDDDLDSLSVISTDSISTDTEDMFTEELAVRRVSVHGAPSSPTLHGAEGMQQPVNELLCSAVQILNDFMLGDTTDTAAVTGQEKRKRITWASEVQEMHLHENSATYEFEGCVDNVEVAQRDITVS
eukprot:TRINITY_DN5005_c0_g1_i1.p1 TRINITY_DN5005_c0_g1~~TRINITY_DN5005_c0_g1_i1.p1  ORF type:complete len:491 (+),score=80.33 TRINITY_DN5005_c0_g1_i1:40-1473(+)